MVGICMFMLAEDEVCLSAGIHIRELSVQFYDCQVDLGKQNF
jgi:hypothetical protein